MLRKKLEFNCWEDVKYWYNRMYGVELVARPGNATPKGEACWVRINCSPECVNTDFSDEYDEAELRIQKMILQHTVVEGHKDWFDAGKKYLRGDLELLYHTRDYDLEYHEGLWPYTISIWKTVNGEIIRAYREGYEGYSSFKYHVLEAHVGTEDDEYDVFSLDGLKAKLALDNKKGG